jgi:hypothetical protein
VCVCSCDDFDQFWYDDTGPPWGGYRRLKAPVFKFKYLQNNDYHLPEDDNHHSHRRGNLKSYIFKIILETSEEHFSS